MDQYTKLVPLYWYFCYLKVKTRFDRVNYTRKFFAKFCAHYIVYKVYKRHSICHPVEERKSQVKFRFTFTELNDSGLNGNDIQFFY